MIAGLFASKKASIHLEGSGEKGACALREAITAVEKV